MENLGKGSFSSVNKALSKSDGKEVVVKTMNTLSMQKSDLFGLIKQEKEILEKINSNYVPKLVDFI